VRIDHLWLTDFRNYEASELRPAPSGLTVITGGNGQGKTNLLEAIGYLATLASFRGAHTDALVRVGAAQAALRAEARRRERPLLIEAAIGPDGRTRTQVNRQPLRRTRDLVGALQVTVFSPDDLSMVKGGPQGRRQYLDDLLVALRPRHDVLHHEFLRILRQRNTLLRQAGGRATPDVIATLDVWDAKMAAAGAAVADARGGLTASLGPAVSAAYGRVAECSAQVTLTYQSSWSGPLADALVDARSEDLRRGVSTVGPHRDDLSAAIDGLPARTHGSQGEQRSLALALRLASHERVAEELESSPVLLLDDVFSELDADRSEALLAALPAGQVLLTTAGPVPAPARPEAVVRVEDGKVLS
jgi:DNA replication and repair protein RecF